MLQLQPLTSDGRLFGEPTAACDTFGCWPAYTPAGIRHLCVGTVCGNWKCTEITGGEGGIRTPDRITPVHAFQACSLDHSDTSPPDRPASCGGPPQYWKKPASGQLAFALTLTPPAAGKPQSPAGRGEAGARRAPLRLFYSAWAEAHPTTHPDPLREGCGL